MNKTHYCYKIEFPGGYYYIGKRSSAVAPELDPYMGSGTKLQNMVGGVKTILETYFTEAEAYLAEIDFIGGRHKTDPLCLNITKGGEGVKDLYWSSEMRYLASLRTQAQFSDPIQRITLSKIMESIQTPERRALQSKKASSFLLGNTNRVGFKDPLDVIVKKTAHLKGNQHKKGKPDSPETRLRKSEAVKGIPKPRIDCPDCGKSVTPNTMWRHKQACVKGEQTFAPN